MYTRKWTRMDWWESVKYFKKYGLLDYQDHHRIFHLFPLKQPEQYLTQSMMKKTKDEYRKDLTLIKQLFFRYPDLKYEPLNKISEGNPINTQNYVFRFIEKQKSLIKQGYTVQKAFEATEQLFQNRIQRKIDQNKLTQGLAVSNRARSFMNYFQQQAEYESRLKVLRMKRDLGKYEESVKKLKEEFNQKSIDQQQQEQQEEEISNEEQNYNNNKNEMYSRVLYKIINEGKQEKQVIDKKKDVRKEVVDEFINRTKNMFKVYIDRASINDRLQGLTDEQIRAQIRDSPKKIKNRASNLLKKLEKLGVKLNDKGEVDFSSIQIENVRNQLEKNPQVKTVLMQKALQYEFPHKENQANQILQYKRNLQDLEEDKKKEKGVDKFKQNLANNKKAENQIQQNQEKGTNQQQKFTTNEVIQESKELLSSKEDTKELEKEEYNLETAYKDSLSEAINENENTYKLFETYEERQARVETKWLKMKIKELEEGDQNLDQKNNQLNEVVDKLRRLKYRIDQKSIVEAKQLLFDEHYNLTKDELLVDSQVAYENLSSYLQLPTEKRRTSEIDEVEDTKINDLIKRKQLNVDFVDNFDKFYEHKLYEKDSVDFQLLMDEQQKKDAQIKTLKQKQVSQEDQFIFKEDQEEVDIQKKDKKASRKEEKKKLMDFIKKANEKQKAKSKEGTKKLKAKPKEK